MPRPKSELTKNGKMIGVRATLGEHNEFMRLGGTRWLRGLLRASIGAKQEAEKKQVKE